MYFQFPSIKKYCSTYFEFGTIIILILMDLIIQSESQFIKVTLTYEKAVEAIGDAARQLHGGDDIKIW